MSWPKRVSGHDVKTVASVLHISSEDGEILPEDDENARKDDEILPEDDENACEDDDILAGVLDTQK